MGTKSKCKTVTHYFTDKETKQRFSNTFRHGGSFGGPGKKKKEKKK